MTPPHDQEERPATGTAPWKGSFSPAATADDILACFRLLLGRLPNREEWRGHVSRAGEPLDIVVGSYVQSLEFSRRGLGAAGTLGAVETMRLPDFSIYYEANDAAVGQHVGWKEFDADVAAVFRGFVRSGMHVLDLGANIGYFTMLSATLVGPSGSVLAIEPNPNNARLIEASRRANGFSHVRVVQVAAGCEAGLLVLHRSHSNGTTSSTPDDAASLLAAETVPCVRVDGIVPRRRRIGFIKADVEGAEYLALSGCLRIIRRDRPVILTEFSPSLMPGISGISGAGYLSWLISLGYRLSIVQPDGSLHAAGPDAIMAEYEARGIDHLDLVAEPVAAAQWAKQRLRRIADRLRRR